MHLLLLLAFIFGTFWGSFIHVMVDRLNRHENFIWSRSKCEACNHILNWYDLIPILSFVITKGHCRYCNSKIPKRLLIVEIVTGLVLSGIVGYFIYYSTPAILTVLFSVLIATCLEVIFFSDLEYGIIPDEVLVFLSIITVVYNVFVINQGILQNVITGLMSFMLFLLLFLLTQGKGMGFGDVKFAFVIGLLLSFQKTVIALYSAFLTGAVISVILILLRRKKFRNDTIAFGPFLVVGIIISIYFGDRIIELVKHII